LLDQGIEDLPRSVSVGRHGKQTIPFFIDKNGAQFSLRDQSDRKTYESNYCAISKRSTFKIFHNLQNPQRAQAPQVFIA
jgi:hypothetical protein